MLNEVLKDVDWFGTDNIFECVESINTPLLFPLLLINQNISFICAICKLEKTTKHIYIYVCMYVIYLYNLNC